MVHFKNINSLAELKKQYRKLALDNHPDRGGKTEVMQEINREFEQLFKIWEYDKTVSRSASGYESDYAGATAKEYSDYVYNEYRWVGSNYKGQSAREIVEILREWLKKTYPGYTFSVRRRDYNSICINLMKADFTAFPPESGQVYKQINHYHIDGDSGITDRAREVMKNVYDFVMSYNFDDSDSMTDYFHTNFYLHLGIGDSTHPYKTEIPKIKCRKSDMAPIFKHPEGPAHKAIRQALGKARFNLYETRRLGKVVLLGEDSYGHKGEHHFWPLAYSSAKTAQKRIDKLKAAGINCKLSGYNSGYILFDGYTEEIELILEKERQEVIKAMKAWNAKFPINQPIEETEILST